MRRAPTLYETSRPGRISPAAISRLEAVMRHAAAKRQERASETPRSRVPAASAPDAAGADVAAVEVGTAARAPRMAKALATKAAIRPLPPPDDRTLLQHRHPRRRLRRWQHRRRPCHRHRTCQHPRRHHPARKLRPAQKLRRRPKLPPGTTRSTWCGRRRPAKHRARDRRSISALQWFARSRTVRARLTTSNAAAKPRSTAMATLPTIRATDGIDVLLGRLMTKKEPASSSAISA